MEARLRIGHSSEKQDNKVVNIQLILAFETINQVGLLLLFTSGQVSLLPALEYSVTIDNATDTRVLPVGTFRSTDEHDVHAKINYSTFFNHNLDDC